MKEISLLSLCPFIPVRQRDLFFVCFDWFVYTPGPIPAELGQLANLRYMDLSNNQLTGNLSFSPPDLHSIWTKRLAFLMPFHTRMIGWLGFCMFWLNFVYPRSHSGWIGPIGQFKSFLFTHKQAHRYSIPLYPDSHSIWRNRLAFLRPVHTSRIGWLVFCMNWLSFVYPRYHSGWIGPIGQFKLSLFRE